MDRMNQVPIIHDVDVVIAGGGSAAVSAAISARRAGASVFVGAMETYFGEDICATGRLWLDPVDGEVPALVREMFGADAGREVVVARPMQVKESLDRAMLEAGAEFLFGCYPAGALRDGKGQLAGLIFATRSGRFAVRAKTIIDATPRALAARLTGMDFRPWEVDTLRFERIVIGHRAENDPGDVGVPMARPLTIEVEERGKAQNGTFDAFLYSFELPAADGTPQSFAEAEQVGRDRSWHRDQIWSSDRLFYVSPDPIVGRTTGEGEWPGAEGLELDCCRGRDERLWVLSGCADVPRAWAEQLLTPVAGVALGARIGQAAAQMAAATTVTGKVKLADSIGVSDLDVRVPLRMDRYADERLPTIDATGCLLPILAEMDVVVAGGGTGGAPAGIAAAGEGARSLVVEYLHGFGGVGTLGFISIYYHGYRDGFTGEVDRGVAELGQTGTPKKGRWNPEHKSEWLRQELRRKGGTAWYGSVATGAVMRGRKLRGIVVATPWGYGIVHAKAVLDCTGNADIAAAAGAPFTTTGGDHMAVQGAGLPYRPLRPDYTNTDYTFIEDADILDSTRAFTVGRRRFNRCFDMAQMVDTRERRQILGETWVTPLDVYAHRTWSDSICLGRSNYDTHGFTIHPLFLVKPPDRESIDALVPIGCFMPREVSGILVTGLALSAHRDVMPVLRMQPDVQNHAYACGLAAAMALSHDGEIRDIDLSRLRRRLVDLRILPEEALTHDDSFPVDDKRVKAAAQSDLDDYGELAIVLAHPDRALPHLRRAYAHAEPGDRQVALAKLLAILGDARGVPTLIEVIAGPWDEGWNYTGMGQFGRSLSPQDDAIVCLAMVSAAEATTAVREKLGQLGPEDAFSHHRAIGMFCEKTGGAIWREPLARLLKMDGIRGHSWDDVDDELGNIPPSDTDTTTRNLALRELVLARALFRCGDADGLGEAILHEYARDIRGHFARHARAVLAG